ncbi:MAG: hypothetical protein KDA99_02810, partial [Planctomycetales bacterium]|nr:hypothetical protein [Planctomycetales bacterium]
IARLAYSSRFATGVHIHTLAASANAALTYVCRPSGPGTQGSMPPVAAPPAEVVAALRAKGLDGLLDRSSTTKWRTGVLRQRVMRCGVAAIRLGTAVGLCRTANGTIAIQSKATPGDGPCLRWGCLLVTR